MNIRRVMTEKQYYFEKRGKMEIGKMTSSIIFSQSLIFENRWTEDTKGRIFQRFPWLNERNQEMVVGTDFDGLLSAALMHEELGWKIIGFYDFETVWYSNGASKEQLRNAIWIDLDVYHPQVRSIGHHILKYRQNDKISHHCQSLNPNLLRGIYHGNFQQKYPLGSIHLLVWLFNYKIPHDQLHKLLFWHPDSSWINGQAQRYRDNVNDWLHNFVPNDLMVSTFADIDTLKFEEEMQNFFFPRISQTGFERGRGQVQSRHLRLRGYQCSFEDPNRYVTQIQKMFSLISEITRWTLPMIPQSYDSIGGTRNSPRYNYKGIREEFGDLDTFLSKMKVFSYAIPNMGEMNYTNNIRI